MPSSAPVVAVPMNVPVLMSAIVALAAPTTFQPSSMLNDRSLPSRDFTMTTPPSTEVTVPRSWTPAARAGAEARKATPSTAAKAAAGSVLFEIM